MKTKFIFCFALVSLAVRPAFGASGLFPKMPAATKVYVVDTRKDSENARMTAWALQGLINQSSAEVYVLSRPFDLEQLEKSGKPFEKLKPLAGSDAGLRTLFQKYQRSVRKMFIYDPDKDWTRYLALMSGAQQDGIPVTESVKDELISEFGWKGDVEDFRSRWSNRIEAYDWALANLMPNCTKRLVFALEKDMPLDDYAVASKGFVFWLDFGKPDEQAEIKKIFSTKGYGVGTSLMGYGNIGDEANETSNPYGIGYVVSDYYSNGSFWSSFPDKTYTQSLGKAVKAEPGKIYANIIWSDGDNLQMDQNPIYRFWNDPAHGTIPVGTELAPALQELNSPLLDWYYSKMTTNDELISVPGIQFIYIQYFNDRLFPAWCRLTRDWCAGAGFHTGHVWMAPIPGLKYSEYMTMCGFDGVLAGGWEIKAGFPPGVDSIGAWDEKDLFNAITKIKPNPQKPIFTGFTCIVQGFYKGDLNGYSAIKRVMDRVEAAYPGRYVFLLPKDEFATIRAYYNTDMPNVTGSPDNANGLTLAFNKDDGQEGESIWQTRGNNGLMPVLNKADGHFTTVEREGRHCWLVNKSAPVNYFYLAVPDMFRPKIGQTLRIDLAYFDGGNGDISMNYDSRDISQPLGGAYKTYPYVFHRQNSKRWKVASFYVNDAGFGHSENNFTDFRFGNEGDDLLISGVQVLRVNH